MAHPKAPHDHQDVHFGHTLSVLGKSDELLLSIEMPMTRATLLATEMVSVLLGETIDH
jgi:hypothetical protein